MDFMFNKYFWSTRNSVPVCQALGPRIYFTTIIRNLVYHSITNNASIDILVHISLITSQIIFLE